MTYEAMLRKINTAGTWFTGVFMGEILRKYPEIHGDTALTTAFIQQMHRDYGEALEYTYDSTKTKCYAVMSIIEGGRVIDAIDHVLQSGHAPPLLLLRGWDCRSQTLGGGCGEALPLLPQGCHH